MSSPVPPSIEPMRAVLAHDMPRDDDNWAYEIKWDGMRAVASVADGKVRLRSANGNDVTVRFPELAGLAAALAPHAAVLDGEIVAFDEAGRPDFGRLQPRMHVASADAAAERARTQPVLYVVFDVLFLDDHLLTDLVYDERRRVLERLIETGPNWRLGTSQRGGGRDLLHAVRTQGLEGLVAKRRDSRYEAGRRSPAWLKLKIRPRQELVVGGWLRGEGGRQATFGALLVGHHAPDGGPLHYAGRVGTGFTERELHRLRDELDARRSAVCPFEPVPPRPVARAANWVRPELVVEVAFAEWTGEGLLRHPSYQGQRVDKDASAVVRESGP